MESHPRPHLDDYWLIWLFALSGCVVIKCEQITREVVVACGLLREDITYSAQGLYVLAVRMPSCHYVIIDHRCLFISSSADPQRWQVVIGLICFEYRLCVRANKSGVRLVITLGGHSNEQGGWRALRG